MLLVLIAVAWLATAGRYLLLDLETWFFRTYVLSEWRVIDSRGFTFTTRRTASLDRIQQVRVTRPNIFAAWFDIGTVEVITAATHGDLKLEAVRHPRHLAQTIVWQQILFGPNVPEAAPFANPIAQAMWERVEEEEARWRPTRIEPGPRYHWTAPITLLATEEIVERVLRSWIALVARLVWPVVFLAVGVGVSLLIRGLGGRPASSAAVMVLVGTVVIGLLWGAITSLNYIDDALILTTQRVVDLDRLFFIFAESRNEALYNKIQDVRVTQSLLGRILNYGTIYVETAGRSQNIEMSLIPDPLRVQDRIFALMNSAQEAKEGRGRRRRRREAKRWMVTLLNQMLVVVPDVRGMLLLDAVAAVDEVGLRLIVDTEEVDPALPAGSVLEQAPYPGSSTTRGSEVRVVLSRQTVPVAGA